MKYLYLPLFILSLAFTSCGDDEPDCDVTMVADVFVGTWEETKIAGLGDEVTFNADFTASCTEESLFAAELNGVQSTNFTWELNADNTEIELDFENGFGLTYNVVLVECDEIILDLLGFNIRLQRK